MFTVSCDCRPIILKFGNGVNGSVWFWVCYVDTVVNEVVNEFENDGSSSIHKLFYRWIGKAIDHDSVIKAITKFEEMAAYFH